jgi:hypothetical protein
LQLIVSSFVLATLLITVAVLVPVVALGRRSTPGHSTPDSAVDTVGALAELDRILGVNWSQVDLDSAARRNSISTTMWLLGSGALAYQAREAQGADRQLAPIGRRSPQLDPNAQGSCLGGDVISRALTSHVAR